MRILLILFIMLLGLSAHSKSFQFERSPGCKELRQAIQLSRLTLGEDFSELVEVRRALCSQLTPEKGSTVRYDNGQLATHYARQAGATWYYPNGQLLTHYMGNSGATWYNMDGSVMTHSAPEIAEARLMFPPRLVARILSGDFKALFF